MKLYEFPPTRSIRPRWVLQELGIPFESRIVNLPAGEHRSPAFLAINPAGKIPVLVDGDLVVNESAAIVLYLADKFPERKLMPTDPSGRAEANRWLLFVTTELEQPLWRIARNTSLYPEDRRQPSDVAIASEEFRAMAAVLERHMQGRRFVVGDTVTVVDFFTAWTLDWANENHLLDQCPTLHAYMERMYQRPHAPERIAAAFERIGLQRATLG